MRLEACAAAKSNEFQETKHVTEVVQDLGVGVEEERLSERCAREVLDLVVRAADGVFDELDAIEALGVGLPIREDHDLEAGAVRPDGQC